MSFEKIWGRIEDDLGFNDHNMRRDRPFNGQPQTHSGIRGAVEVQKVTFRDLRDCWIRAIIMATNDQHPAKYEEALKGENGVLCENDLYGFNLNSMDPMAAFQCFACEVEKIMGIYPNVQGLSKEPS